MVLALRVRTTVQQNREMCHSSVGEILSMGDQTCIQIRRKFPCEDLMNHKWNVTCPRRREQNKKAKIVRRTSGERSHGQKFLHIVIFMNTFMTSNWREPAVKKYACYKPGYWWFFGLLELQFLKITHPHSYTTPRTATRPQHDSKSAARLGALPSCHWWVPVDVHSTPVLCGGGCGRPKRRQKS